MKLINSGAITDIVDYDDHSYKLNFCLYDSVTKHPSSVGRFHSKINFEHMQYHYFIQEMDSFEEGKLINSHLVMEYGLPYDGTKFILILSKGNKDIIQRIKESHYEFEMFMNEENPIMCALKVVDSRLLRADKLKQIREKMNGLI